MTFTRKPVCFIAMAFGYDDTDEYYEKLVLPVLIKNNIAPVIINRSQSNDDINFQIYKKLREVDFCITDLTYTRPSVYFEAGFAEREVPVIYTVRKDHLDRKQPDDRRVHFDLQMKPIIDWTSSTDKKFSKRLENRIKNTFLLDWLRKQKIDIKLEEEERKFNSLSVSSRLIDLRRQCVEDLIKLGYKKTNWFDRTVYDETTSVNRTAISAGYINYVYGYKVEKNKLFLVTVQSFVSPTKNVLFHLSELYSSNYFSSSSLADRVDMKKIKEININVIVLSLRLVSEARIENALPFIVSLEKPRRYTQKLFHSESYQYVKSQNRNINYYFLSGINSIVQLKKELHNYVLNNI